MHKRWQELHRNRLPQSQQSQLALSGQTWLSNYGLLLHPASSIEGILSMRMFNEQDEATMALSKLRKLNTHLTKFLRFKISKGPGSVNKCNYWKIVVIRIFHHSQSLPIAVYKTTHSIEEQLFFI